MAKPKKSRIPRPTCPDCGNRWEHIEKYRAFPHLNKTDVVHKTRCQMCWIAREREQLLQACLEHRLIRQEKRGRRSLRSYEKSRARDNAKAPERMRNRYWRNKALREADRILRDGG